jgi:pimeloyl-ACP methyl ester carboxylesterase
MKTIILVHGAWADGSSWDKVAPILIECGHKVVAVHQPLTSLADDAAAVRRVIHAQQGQVILVGHSYGGVVITEAGNDAKVDGLVYVAAFGPDAGESVNELGKGGPVPEWAKTMKVEEGYSVLSSEAVASEFAQDLPAMEQKVLAAKQGWIAMAAFDGKPSKAAWRTKPSWFVVAANDRMIPPQAEELMASRMKAKITKLPTSHVAMLSKPREVATVILEAAKG